VYDKWAPDAGLRLRSRLLRLGGDPAKNRFPRSTRSGAATSS